MTRSSSRSPRRPRPRKETGPSGFTVLIRWVWGLAMMAILIIFGVSVATRILEPEDKAGDKAAVHAVDSIFPIETSVTVIVLNGCGVNGLAGHVRDLLLDGGCFDVIDVDDADDYHYSETLIVDLTGRIDLVQQVADFMQSKLSVGRIVHHQVANPPAAVIIILGSDAASPGGSSI
ncbi:MAG: LytR C-terminal domain-containing protein [Candidatus Eisenbacteria bacterium]|uniref:LytR C-terminal domain-containing protein n=1 Tax=Eiseniibacteriota bacterium TaxID=2212470 RepID=A0A948W535_UNCEI|nr:LytR C-terminal domain-containing protein [Candidatus Eisenbacteria bacterium]MBU1950168.1 LytR C-terminal domain-containing protein [Candidatus Eisenbacteria bacterium]MBU2689620.1 LytR C-terminal domain-containing protein [Candidatus Eisenbacteria bacterium]